MAESNNQINLKLLVFSPYYPPHTGGLESHADEFNKYLSLEGVIITVFIPRLPKDALENETKYNGVEIIRFPAFEIISNYPLPKFWSIKFWKLFLELFRKDFDVVISRTRFFSTSLLALIYAKTKRIKWIHVEHGSDFVELSSKFKTFIARIYDQTLGFLVFRLSDLNVSVSKAVRQFVKKFDKRNSLVIYRGIDFEEIDKINPGLELKEKYKDKTIISFCGRLYKWKGVEKSVKAVKSLSEEIKKKIIFLIIGDGEDYKRLKNLIGKDETIKMLGGLDRKGAISILKISDIYLHSSLPGGGLSTSLLEAMYCGCAVIATPNEGANEVVVNGENGILLEGDTAEEVSRKITELIGDKDKVGRFSQSAIEFIARKFSWKESIQKYLSILNDYEK